MAKTVSTRGVVKPGEKEYERGAEAGRKVDSRRSWAGRERQRKHLEAQSGSEIDSTNA